jgi:hypothetical protein
LDFAGNTGLHHPHVIGRLLRDLVRLLSTDAEHSSLLEV